MAPDDQSGNAAAQVTLLGSGAILTEVIQAAQQLAACGISAYLPAGRRYLTLGTDGFGRGVTRAALRAVFGVDAASIVRATRHALG